MAMRRKVHNRRRDRRRFSKTAAKTHKRNIRARTARGGFRL
jgi:hypothetical protein